ncbi:MAG: YgiQ family radical SAM protein, partial [Oscillospiraceae bacterium]|nr:YgiQ family radical SAM protein [Oscillospiraceae bacterium]
MAKNSAPGGFLPASREEMIERGWYYYDFLVVTGDAYVDHFSFGAAVISRVLEAEGYRVGLLAQPAWQSAEDFSAMGRPRFGVLVGAGNLDSMVAHYTAAKKRRSEDFYSPGKQSGLRPDRAGIVYCLRAREAFPGLPVILGGLEASLRRFAHYDYWDDKIRRSQLFDAKADILVYGMGERATREIARRLSSGETADSICDVRGTAVALKSAEECRFPHIECPSFDLVSRDKRAYAEAAMTQYEEHDAVRGHAVLQLHGDRLLCVNPPSPQLSAAEFDRVAELPYMRTYHPKYGRLGGVPAIEEVRFSLVHNRGCFGACNFCALAFHQGRTIAVRSHDSLLREAQILTRLPDFKGYIHDVGGPTANFR